MSKNEIVSLIETMNNYDELANKAKAKADAIRDALKEEMLRLDTEELNAGAYIVRYRRSICPRPSPSSYPHKRREYAHRPRGSCRRRAGRARSFPRSPRRAHTGP